MSDTTSIPETSNAAPVPVTSAPPPSGEQPFVADPPLLPALPPPSTPALSLSAGSEPVGQHERRWVKVAVRTLLGASLVGLAALSAYLWMVNGQWIEQNDQLRAEALELGETLATERAEAELQAEQLALIGSQLDSATARISDLANEEANAIDDRKLLESLVENYRFCSDQRQTIIDVLTDSRLYFPGSSAAQVERTTTAACNEVNANFEAYQAERASR